MPSRRVGVHFSLGLVAGSRYVMGPMSRFAPRTSSALSALVLLAGPFVWLACGGGKPPETPADESATGDDSGSSAATADSSNSETPAPAASGGDEKSSSDSSPASSAAAAPAAPPTPNLGDTDCGKCIDKTCAKPAAACGKNTDCQAMIDSIHGCSSGAASCIDNASPPSAAKPKKLAAGYGKCAKKAITSKACKAACQ
jgi:hypothetical protein